MNRQDRRKLLKDGEALKDTLSNVRKESYIRSSKEAVQVIGYTIALELHDKHGWGKVRINKLLEHVSKQLECISSKYVDFEDIKSECVKLGVIL